MVAAHSPFDLNEPDRPLVGNRYKLLKQLGKGSFCVAYLGQHMHKPAEGLLCIKVEKTNDEKQRFRQLRFEAKLYEKLQREEGFPTARHFGREKTFNFLAMELLGPNLEELYSANNHKFSLKCVCIVAIQMINRLEALHKYGFIHRDIKPENFLIGRKSKAAMVYMCDMGLCKQYRDSVTNVHIPFQTNRSLAGTARYASVNALSGNEQSRRDDIESLGYLLVYLVKGILPWQGLKGEDRRQKYQRICDCKKNTPVDELCQGLVSEFNQYVAYSKALRFEEDPDYSFLRGLFENRLSALNSKYPHQPSRLDWLVNVPEKFKDIIDANAPDKPTETVDVRPLEKLKLTGVKP